MEQTLAGLGNRVFLMNNVHDEHPIVFITRWALSYLRGPLTRNQIKTLMDPARAELSAGAVKKETNDSRDDDGEHSDSRAVLPPEVPQFFVPIRNREPKGRQLVYQAACCSAARRSTSATRRPMSI